MAEKIHNKTQGIVNDIKSGLHGIHGAGEALRGGTMEALDGVFHKREGEAKNREIAERGLAEMKGTEDRIENRHLEHHHEGSSLGFGHSSHPQSHGQGSHFANAHGRDVPAAPVYDSTAAGVGSEEGDGAKAARAAWLETERLA